MQLVRLYTAAQPAIVAAQGLMLAGTGLRTVGDSRSKSMTMPSFSPRVELQVAGGHQLLQTPEMKELGLSVLVPRSRILRR